MNHVDYHPNQYPNIPEKDINHQVGYLKLEEEGDEETEEIEWLKEQEKKEKKEGPKGTGPPVRTEKP